MAIAAATFMQKTIEDVENGPTPIEDGTIAFDTSTGELKVYTAHNGGWITLDSSTGASGEIAISDGTSRVDDIHIEPVGTLNLPDDERIKYAEPEKYKVGDLVRRKDWDGKTFGVVEWASNLEGDDSVHVRWDYVEDNCAHPEYALSASLLERQRDTALMYDLMQRKIEEGRHKFKVGDAVYNPSYPGSFGVLLDDPETGGGWVNIDWKPPTYGMIPPYYCETKDLEPAPLGRVLEDQMQKIKDDQEQKFQEQRWQIEQQETKLQTQETQLAILNTDKMLLEEALSQTKAETQSLASRFEMAIKRIEQLEGVGLEEEAREVERNEALPVLASMSKKERIKTLATTVAGVVGKQVLSRLANQSGLTQWIVNLFLGN